MKPSRFISYGFSDLPRYCAISDIERTIIAMANTRSEIAKSYGNVWRGVVATAEHTVAGREAAGEEAEAAAAVALPVEVAAVTMDVAVDAGRRAHRDRMMHEQERRGMEQDGETPTPV